MIMEQYIKKSALVAEIERRQKIHFNDYHINGNNNPADYGACNALTQILDFINTLEVKEVNITEMADDYYDALMKEAADWMDEGTMGHCRLAYYTGCKDVLNKIQKGE